MAFRFIAPPFTPMHPNGDVHWELIETQAEYLSEHGVQGIFVCGSTGEGMSLMVEERMQMAERWVAAGRRLGLEIIVQVGHTVQRDSMRLASHAERCGADSIATAAPCYFKPATVTDLVEYCLPIAESVELPFYYYHIPRMTGVDLPLVEFLRQAQPRIGNLAGLKYSSLDMVQLQELIRWREGEFEILFGCDQALLAGIVLGVCGGIGSTYNFASSLYLQLVDAFDSGDHAEARRLQAQSVALVRALETHVFLPSAKYAMSLLGIDCGPVRAPLPNLTDDQKSDIARRLHDLSFLDICRTAIA